MLRAHRLEREPTATPLVAALEQRPPARRPGVRAPLPAPALGRAAAAGRDRDRARRASRRVVVLDEPTTGLDVVTQARILEEIDRLRRERGVAVVYVTHDLAVVASIADRIAVMYAGRIVEEGPSADVLTRPRHPYTRGLLSSVPDHGQPRRIQSIPGVAVGVGERPPGLRVRAALPAAARACARGDAARSRTWAAGHRVRCFEWRRTPPLEVEELAAPPPAAVGEAPLLVVESLRAEHGGRFDTVVAARDVSFDVLPASASRSWASRAAARRRSRAASSACTRRPRAAILLDGVPLAGRAAARPREARRRIQIVFQNPNDSLNPRHRVGDAIARPARILRDLSAKEAARRGRSPARARAAAGAAGRPLPRRALRRRAAARRDRPGAGRRPGPRRLRRDHVGARRLGAGGGPRAARRAPRRARPRAALHHARPRASSPRSPTACSCSTAARSARTAPSRRCSPVPSTSTRGGSWPLLRACRS